jgi:predicted Zn-dependent peptidase
VLRLENPQGLIVYGLGREVLDDPALEPEEVLAGYDSVTVEDVQRVAQDVIASDRLKLALIGPFEDAAPFEALVADSN